MPRVQTSRIINKRSVIPGVIPTIGPTTDHTDGSWVDNEIYPGEFFVNLADEIVYFGWTTGSTTTPSSGVTQMYPYLGPPSTGATLNLTAGSSINISGTSPNFFITITGTTGANEGWLGYYENEMSVNVTGGVTDIHNIPGLDATIGRGVIYLKWIALGNTLPGGGGVQDVCCIENHNTWFSDGTSWSQLGTNPNFDFNGKNGIFTTFNMTIVDIDNSGNLAIEFNSTAGMSNEDFKIYYSYWGVQI